MYLKVLNYNFVRMIKCWELTNLFSYPIWKIIQKDFKRISDIEKLLPISLSDNLRSNYILATNHPLLSDKLAINYPLKFIERNSNETIPLGFTLKILYVNYHNSLQYSYFAKAMLIISRHIGDPWSSGKAKGSWLISRGFKSSVKDTIFV